jgi:hypothetical protein
MAFIHKVIAWVESLLRDPRSGDASSVRVVMLLFTAGAIIVALIAVLLKRDGAATVAVLAGAATGGSFARAKAEGPPSEPKG